MKNWLGIVSAFLFFAIGLPEIQTFAQDAAPSKKIAVAYRAAIFRDSGASDTCALASLQILNNTAGFEAKYVSAQEIRDGLLKDFDVVPFVYDLRRFDRLALLALCSCRATDNEGH